MQLLWNVWNIYEIYIYKCIVWKNGRLNRLNCPLEITCYTVWHVARLHQEIVMHGYTIHIEINIIGYHWCCWGKLISDVIVVAMGVRNHVGNTTIIYFIFIYSIITFGYCMPCTAIVSALRFFLCIMGWLSLDKINLEHRTRFFKCSQLMVVGCC